MDSLIETKNENLQSFMTDIVAYSLYGLGSINSLLNMKVHELEVLKWTLKDENIKDIFKAVKLRRPF